MVLEQVDCSMVGKEPLSSHRSVLFGVVTANIHEREMLFSKGPVEGAPLKVTLFCFKEHKQFYRTDNEMSDSKFGTTSKDSTDSTSTVTVQTP